MRLIHIVPSIETRYGGPSVSVPKLAAALREFIADIEAVGLKALKDENDPNYWPDLVPTYRHAKAAMKEAGL